MPETPLRIIGKDAAAFLQKLFTRNVKKLKVGRAVYALACNHQGGVLMDGVLMRPNDQEFIYVQGNGDFLNWANANLGALDASISDFNSWVLQVQGPTALDLMTAVTGIDQAELSYYAVTEAKINGLACYISRSGWTGERGFEIYSKDDDFDGVALWQYLLRDHRAQAITLFGLKHCEFIGQEPFVVRTSHYARQDSALKFDDLHPEASRVACLH